MNLKVNNNKKRAKFRLKGYYRDGNEAWDSRTESSSR